MSSKLPNLCRSSTWTSFKWSNLYTPNLWNKASNFAKSANFRKVDISWSFTLKHSGWEVASISSKETFEEIIRKFKSRLLARGYPKSLIKTRLSDVTFTERTSALQQKNDTRKQILPFVTQYQPAVPRLKHVLMEKWHLIQNQPSLQQIFKEPSIISFKKSESLNDILVRAKI